MSACCSTESSHGVAARPAAGAKNCPECGQPGKSVETKTLKQMVQPCHLELVNKPGFLFCRSADCDVVYFHPEGDCLRRPDVRVRVGLKETEDPVPICYCFGFTEAMAVEEVRNTGQCTIPQRITAEVKAGNCACEIRNPQGSCCLGNVNAAVKRATQAERSGGHQGADDLAKGATQPRA
jgi:hypothetical protein